MSVFNRNLHDTDTAIRIRALQEERLQIQKKTFTKWINSYLTEDGEHVTDLFTDLSDGKILLSLLRIISGEEFALPTQVKFRAHKIENIYKCLSFLNTKVRLESIGPEDIVDGNPILVMGLVWTIIARFEIQEILGDMNNKKSSNQPRSLTAKAALLLWCQQRTVGYPGVNVVDFSSSWRDGLAFNALVHHFRPQLIQFGTMKADNYLLNLNNAFTAAESGLGIPKLLDAEDFGLGKPDEKSVITYLSSFYHHCAKLDDNPQEKNDLRTKSSTRDPKTAENYNHNSSSDATSDQNTLFDTIAIGGDDRPVVTEWTCSTCKRRYPSDTYLCPHCRDNQEEEEEEEKEENGVTYSGKQVTLPVPRSTFVHREIIDRAPFTPSVIKNVTSVPGRTKVYSVVASYEKPTNRMPADVTATDDETTEVLTRIVPSNTVEDKSHGLSVISKFLTRRKLFETVEPVKETKNPTVSVLLPETPKKDAQYSAKLNTLECEIIFLKEQYYQQLDVFESKIDSLDKQIAKFTKEKLQLETIFEEMKSNSGELKMRIRAVENSVQMLRAN